MLTRFISVVLVVLPVIGAVAGILSVANVRSDGAFDLRLGFAEAAPRAAMPKGGHCAGDRDGGADGEDCDAL